MIDKISNMYKKSSIRVHLFSVYFFTLAGILIIMSLIIVTFTKQSLLKELSKSQQDILLQVSERANIIRSSSITALNLITYDDYIITELGEDHLDEIELENYLKLTKKNYDHVFGDIGIDYEIIILSENGFNYHSKMYASYDFVGLKNQLLFNNVYDSKEDVSFISNFEDKFGGTKSNYVFSVSRAIRNSDGDRIATALITIKENHLKKLYETLLHGENIIYIVDDKGNVISHPDSSFLGLNFFNIEKFNENNASNEFNIISKSSGDYLITIVENESTSWSIIEEIATKYVFREVYDIVNWIILITVLCLLVTVIISVVVTNRVVRPIYDLSEIMNVMSAGDLEVRSDIESYKEINNLSASFNSMATQITQLLDTSIKQESYRRKIEMNFLRAQINPHFLYNTLFSIRCMAEMDKGDDLIEMIDAFMGLLKSTISSDEGLISIEQELTSTAKYLELQKIRYNNKFEYEIICEDSVKTQSIPSLILQPIVENSIFHGIEPKLDYGGITIQAYEVNDQYLAVDIIDNGIGMDDDQIKEIKKKFSNFEIMPDDSIGLANVANRLHLAFNGLSELDIISELDKGTIIRLFIPKTVKGVKL